MPCFLSAKPTRRQKSSGSFVAMQAARKERVFIWVFLRVQGGDRPYAGKALVTSAGDRLAAVPRRLQHMCYNGFIAT